MDIFLREAAKMDEARQNHKIIATWLGGNVDQKGLKKLLSERQAANKAPEDKQADHQRDWNRLSSFMRGMR